MTSARFTIFFCCLGFAISALGGAETPAYPDPEDDFNPGLLIFVVFFCSGVLFLVGFGAVVGGFLAMVIATAVAIGVVSSSALVAIVNRRFSSGFRALRYQITALAVLPCGVGAVWLGAKLLNINLASPHVIATGSITGIAAGVLMAWILDRFTLFAIHRFASRIPHHRAAFTSNPCCEMNFATFAFTQTCFFRNGSR